MNTSTAPQALVQKTKGISLIWVVPLVAILIGAGLVYKAVTEKGPVITITFKTAEGLEAGKTKIKYKDVDVGKVETIKLSDDLGQVIVTANLGKGTKPYLNEKTRFYVVKARFSGGVATGLGTLLSGSYIAIDPGKGDSHKTHFTGLEIPPIITSDQPGKHFRLKANQLGSLQYGSPIYFKGIKVGQVAGYEFSGQTKDLSIKVFIEAPYDKAVNENTRFWFASGLDMELDANGIRIDTQSFISLMIGGIAFANPDYESAGALADEGHVFPLYESSADALAKHFTIKEYYLLKFDHSVRGLSIGAPVEFRGFPVGEVVDISLEHDYEKNLMKIPVRIEVEPEIIQQLTNNKENPKDSLEKMVNQGLRAQLKTGNLISGSKFVAVDFYKSADPASLIFHNDIIEIPTIPAPLDEMADNLTVLLDKIAQIPYDEIGTATLDMVKGLDETSKSFRKAGDGINDIVQSESVKNAVIALNQSLNQIQSLTRQLEEKIPSALDTVSGETIETLDEIKKLTASDSVLIFELKQTLKEFSKTAQSIRRLADHLERHPESILQGKGKE